LQFDLSPARRADAIAALQREIVDVALVDCAADGAVHDADAPPPALLQVVVVAGCQH
jgi:hypothetical protein